MYNTGKAMYLCERNIFINTNHNVLYTFKDDLDILLTARNTYRRSPICSFRANCV